MKNISLRDEKNLSLYQNKGNGYGEKFQEIGTKVGAATETKKEGAPSTLPCQHISEFFYSAFSNDVYSDILCKHHPYYYCYPLTLLQDERRNQNYGYHTYPTYKSHCRSRNSKHSSYIYRSMSKSNSSHTFSFCYTPLHQHVRPQLEGRLSFHWDLSPYNLWHH